MPLTYAQLDALTTDSAFLARVRTAVANHAYFWESNPDATNATLNWCSQVFIYHKLAAIAAFMAPELCQDSKITSSTTGDGSDVTDADLQTAVGAYCEKYSGS